MAVQSGAKMSKAGQKLYKLVIAAKIDISKTAPKNLWRFNQERK